MSLAGIQLALHLQQWFHGGSRMLQKVRFNPVSARPSLSLRFLIFPMGIRVSSLGGQLWPLREGHALSMWKEWPDASPRQVSLKWSLSILTCRFSVRWSLFPWCWEISAHHNLPLMVRGYFLLLQPDLKFLRVSSTSTCHKTCVDNWHSLASKSIQSRMHFNFGFCSLIRCRTSQFFR